MSDLHAENAQIRAVNFLPRVDINTARRAASETSHGVL